MGQKWVVVEVVFTGFDSFCVAEQKAPLCRPRGGIKDVLRVDDHSIQMRRLTIAQTTLEEERKWREGPISIGPTTS